MSALLTIFFDREESAINQASSWRLYRHAALRLAIIRGIPCCNDGIDFSQSRNLAPVSLDRDVDVRACAVLSLRGSAVCAYLYATLPSTASRRRGSGGIFIFPSAKAFLLIYSAHDKRSDKLLIGVVIFGEILLSVPQRLSGVIERTNEKDR